MLFGKTKAIQEELERTKKELAEVKAELNAERDKFVAAKTEKFAMNDTIGSIVTAVESLPKTGRNWKAIKEVVAILEAAGFHVVFKDA